MNKTAIITGITGQDGAYLAQTLLKNNYRVIGLTRDSVNYHSDGLKYLNIINQITILEYDLMNLTDIKTLIKKYQPDEIYNFAAQSSVGLSFSKPIETISFNTISVVNFLEAIKELKPNTKFYQASSCEIFGNVAKLPVTENSVLSPISPYAISKAAAHLTVASYRENYQLFACCGILFNHESHLRGDNFFVKKVIKSAIKIQQGQQQYLEVGNIDLKRDFGFAPKYVEAIFLMMQQSTPEDYIICSGKSLSLREIVYYVFKKLNISQDRLIINENFFRPNEIIDVYGDNSKATNKLHWQYNLDFYQILDKLIDEEKENFI